MGRLRGIEGFSGIETYADLACALFFKVLPIYTENGHMQAIADMNMR